jgi:hypothetical protein
LDLTSFTFSLLNELDDLSMFNCNDEQINEFLSEDSKNFQKEKIANTYIFKNHNEIAAFFSICNDCLIELGYENNIWNKFHRKIKLPNDKRIKQYPAVKIARLGIDIKYQGQGISHQLLDFIKYWTFIEHKPACRLLILDAYNKEKQLQMYLKNDFVFLMDSDKSEKHRFMYFDLLRLE